MGDEIKGDKYVFNNAKIGAVGRNAKSSPEQKDSEKENAYDSAKQSELKTLLAENRLEDCFTQMIASFKQVQNKNGLNLVIHQSALYHELKQKEDFELLPLEEIRLRKNKLINALIHIIDTEFVA